MADYEYLNSTGVIVPDTSAIQEEVENEYKAAFGEDLIVTPDTPQGMLITAEVLARSDVVRNNANLANQINPNVATGDFLDAIMALTGMQRTAATPTTVSNVTMTGVAGTVIPAGSLAATAAGDQFETVSEITLDSSGNGTVDFQATTNGAVACGVGDLTTIVSNVLGWETVNNTTAGVVGATTQSDQEARALRRNTLAFQGVSLAEAITSAVYNVSGVKSLWFQENTCSSIQTINCVSMSCHSVYLCVDGGTDNDIAAALLENKSSGAAWNGSTTVNVTEPASGQTYEVKFDRPAEIGILVKVYTTNGNSTDISTAILDYAAGNISGLDGFIVGADVSPFEIAAAIVSEFPDFYIQKVEISLTSPVSYSTDQIEIDVNQIAVTQASYISTVIS